MQIEMSVCVCVHAPTEAECSTHTFVVVALGEKFPKTKQKNDEKDKQNS